LEKKAKGYYMRGVLALDIDGTLTNEAHSMPRAVAQELIRYANEGWVLFFVTGRTFKWAWPLFKDLGVPYFLALQNGALLLKMPERQILAKNYLPMSILEKVGEYSPDCAIFSGFENEDIVYYRRDRFDKEELDYLDFRKNLLLESWVDVQDFSRLPFSSFASLKWIGREGKLEKIVQDAEKRGLHLPLNRDPVQEGYFVAQGTHADATKGLVLKGWLQTMPNFSGPVIAAGDDANDLSMLLEADVKVVMEGSPDALIRAATVIAPPAAALGIIQGLKWAIERYG
jgi:HAD superfamily hydrolase (TIGR01484 family)